MTWPEVAFAAVIGLVTVGIVAFDAWSERNRR